MTEPRFVKNYYHRLGIPRNADQKSIESAYKKLAKKWHPDMHECTSKRKDAEDNFKAVSEAYQSLHSPTSRDKYDSSTSPFPSFAAGGRGKDDVDDNDDFGAAKQHAAQLAELFMDLFSSAAKTASEYVSATAVESLRKRSKAKVRMRKNQTRRRRTTTQPQPAHSPSSPPLHRGGRATSGRGGGARGSESSSCGGGETCFGGGDSGGEENESLSPPSSSTVPFVAEFFMDVNDLSKEMIRNGVENHVVANIFRQGNRFFPLLQIPEFYDSDEDLKETLNTFWDEIVDSLEHLAPTYIQIPAGCKNRDIIPLSARSVIPSGETVFLLFHFVLNATTFSESFPLAPPHRFSSSPNHHHPQPTNSPIGIFVMNDSVGDDGEDVVHVAAKISREHFESGRNVEVRAVIKNSMLFEHTFFQSESPDTWFELGRGLRLVLPDQESGAAIFVMLTVFL
jgi:curved DNA-binding protein CbpA